SDLAARYGQVDRMFEQIVANLRRGMFQGKVSPRVNVQRTVDSLDALLAKDSRSSPLLPPRERFSGLGDAAAARERIRSAIENSVLPGLRRYRDFLAGDLLPRARKDAGIWAVPGGEACYASLLAHHTGGKRSAHEIHEFGMRLLTSIEAEMESIAKAGSQPDIARFR